MKNFDAQKELDAQIGNEWQFGAVEVDLAQVPLASRLSYLPDGVLQYNNVMDSNGCASRGPLNILETKLDYFWDHGMLPEIKKWMDEKGYREGGKFKLCDAFIEILSGTTPTGNSLKAPLDALRVYGAIPAKLIPLDSNMTWSEYMNPARVTQEYKDLGKQFLSRITLAYEQVSLSQFAHALEVDLLDVAGYAWPQPVNGVYQKTEGGFNHCFTLVEGAIDAFDNYTPFVKRLAKDYIFFEWGYSISITKQTIPEPLSELPKDKADSLWSWLLKMIPWIQGGAKGPMPPIPKNLQ